MNTTKPPQKTCTKCRELKPLHLFDQLRRGSGEIKGRSARCSACRVRRKRSRRLIVLRSDGLKECRRCERALPIKDFYADASRQDGATSWCRECLGPLRRAAGQRYRNGPQAEKRRAATRQWNADLRLDVLRHYSNGKMMCACCGETGLEFLTLDHIHGNGSQHRRELLGNPSAGGMAFYSKIRQQGFPSGLQVLCFNCNMAKRDLPHCPHENFSALRLVSHG